MKPSIDASFKIEKMSASDWPQVRSIYLAGIATGNASFEADAPSWGKWDEKHLLDFRLVARNRNGVVGWAALSSVSARRVYSGVAEVSVYVAPEAQQRGVGFGLLQGLIEASERGGIWTLQSGIFPENEASIRLHLKCGFREVGRRERMGKRDGVWRDSLLLERRSKIVGID